MEASFRKVRLIQWVLLVALVLFASITELLLQRGGSADWNWRHWLLVGYSAYAVSVALRFRRRLFDRAIETLRNSAGEAKAARSWEAGNIISFLMAENVALCGLVIRFVFHGAFWQAALFYAAGFFLLLLWTPRLSDKSASS